MMLEPEQAAALVAERLRRAPRAWTGTGAGAAQAGRVEAGRDWLVQRTLEELGIHCEATGALQDLKGFLIASHRGAEIVLSDKLDEEERVTVYAHLLAHALLEEEPSTTRSFISRLEYVEGRDPGGRTSAEQKVERVADALAQAIVRGRLDGAPEYAYKRTKRTRERSMAGAGRHVGLRPALGRLVLDMCHRFSLALFWHSPRYQKLRSRQEMAFLVRRLQDLVRVAYAC